MPSSTSATYGTPPATPNGRLTSKAKMAPATASARSTSCHAIGWPLCFGSSRLDGREEGMKDISTAVNDNWFRRNFGSAHFLPHPWVVRQYEIFAYFSTLRNLLTQHTDLPDFAVEAALFRLTRPRLREISDQRRLAANNCSSSTKDDISSLAPCFIAASHRS